MSARVERMNQKTQEQEDGDQVEQPCPAHLVMISAHKISMVLERPEVQIDVEQNPPGADKAQSSLVEACVVLILVVGLLDKNENKSASQPISQLCFKTS